jgi:3-oxoacyl-[acyl-carrier-protein] synthase III
MTKRAFLTAIEYKLGEPRDIGEIPELRADPEQLAAYRARGLESFAPSELEPRALAENVARRSIARAGVDPKDVDVVLYATDQLTQEKLFGTAELNQLSNELGLVGAFPLGISLAGCANFGPALETAASLVQAGRARNVLVLLIDKLVGEHSRVMDLGMSVLSDAAVAGIVNAGPGEYELLAFGRASRPQIERLSMENDTEEFFRLAMDGVATAIGSSLATLGMTPGDVTRLFTNNYMTHVQAAFIKHAGFRPEQCFFDNISRFAHAFSADTLVNLSDCSARGGLAVGERCVLLGTAPATWASVVLERSSDGPPPAPRRG